MWLLLLACHHDPVAECADPWSVPSGRGCEEGGPAGFYAGYQDALACNGPDTASSYPSSLATADGGADDCADDCACPEGTDCAPACEAAWVEGYAGCWQGRYAEGYAAGDAAYDCDDM